MSIHTNLELAQALRARAQEKLRLAQLEVQNLTEKQLLSEQALIVLRQLLDQEVGDAVTSTEKLLTEGLRAVFTDQDLSVRAETNISRGKVSVDVITVQNTPDGPVEGVSSDAFGGAVSTVQSALLRIVVASRRGLRLFFILDETFPAFDSRYVVNMAEFLKKLCQSLTMDILLVTHSSALADAAANGYVVMPDKGGVRLVKT